MPRKSQKLTKSKKKSISQSKVRCLLIILFILLGILGLLLYNRSQNKTCANSISCLGDLKGEYQKEAKEAIFMDKKIKVPSEIVYKPNLAVLGEKTPKVDKHIYVDLTNQMLYAYENGKTVMSFLVSTGKWGRTPTGDFKIWVKLRYTTMSGGNPALGTYYYLPNVPYVMFYYNDEVPKSQGYSLHGTYWHDNFGHPMSHGCINMRNEDVAKLYEWANPVSKNYATYATNDDPGTTVTVYGVAPES